YFVRFIRWVFNQQTPFIDFRFPHLSCETLSHFSCALPAVTDVRVCGAIGVIECDRPVDLAVATPAALDRGVWLRPFRNLVYAMPPYICTPAEITQITSAMVEVARLVGSLP
ncbi:aminotransferase class III-fold pyridoxal phosphate-dependent enzyme, partial [Mycobacterium tuberculosis]